jgi:hypothetical protein
MAVFPVAMTVRVTTVVIVANSDTNWAYVNAKDSRIRCRGQQSQCEDRRDNSFHDDYLSGHFKAARPVSEPWQHNWVTVIRANRFQNFEIPRIVSICAT